MKTFGAIFTTTGSVVAILGAGLALLWWTEDLWRGPPVEVVSTDTMTMSRAGFPYVRRTYHVRYGTDCVAARWLQNGLAVSMPGELVSFSVSERDRTQYVPLAVAAELPPAEYAYHEELRCELNPITTFVLRLPSVAFNVTAPQ